MKDSNRFLNRDIIKYIAVFAMLLNHISFIFLDQRSFWGILLTDVGYFTGITMIWFLVEGYAHARSRKKYGQRLLLFAVISQVPYCLAFTKDTVLTFYGFSMIYTLFICFLIVHVWNTWQEGTKKLLVVIALVCATAYADWGILGPLYTIWFVQAGLDREKQKKAWEKAVLIFGFLNFVSILDQYTVLEALLYAAGSMITPALAGICILYLYNGKKMAAGRKISKWFFYLFYPGHLLVLGVLRIAAGL